MTARTEQSHEPSAVARPRLGALAVGDQIGTRTVELDRSRLVRYAGASGDFNRIHWDQEFAEGVGLPGVIAHGMLTMGSVVGLVTEWAGDPGAVVDYTTRFSRPVPVPADGVATVEVSGKIGAIDVEAGTTRVDLTVTFEGAKVLMKTQAVVRLDG
ncbi:MaoC family dehydratase [Myceligenerans indicum]|uniref:MaoC family dehydratase n=1 Tax=Myceligenerans indicum TaxID=2593663 RepID=A0ABS1LGP6_9MICO|nr:MaoC family dehydratase [Myceligenerans indicum]MBL0885402.1 MaoC family dehydratase [Myceligenerans indicum]